MKNRIRTFAVLVLSALMVMTFMTGCSSKPTADDAKAYVQATMDLMCTGDYDHSVKLADIEEGNETAVRDEMIDEVITELTGSMGLDEEAANASRMSCSRLSAWQNTRSLTPSLLKAKKAASM